MMLRKVLSLLRFTKKGEKIGMMEDYKMIFSEFKVKLKMFKRAPKSGLLPRNKTDR